MDRSLSFVETTDRNFSHGRLCSETYRHVVPISNQPCTHSSLTSTFPTPNPWTLDNLTHTNQPHARLTWTYGL